MEMLAFISNTISTHPIPTNYKHDGWYWKLKNVFLIGSKMTTSAEIPTAD
jgi:hypothetical protein